MCQLIEYKHKYIASATFSFTQLIFNLCKPSVWQECLEDPGSFVCCKQIFKGHQTWFTFIMFTVLCSSFFFGETSRKLLSPASGVQNESKWCFWQWPRFSLVTWHMSVHFRIPAPGCTKFCTAKLTGWKFVTGLWSHSKKLMINSSHDNRYFTYRKVFTCHLAHVSTFHAPQLLVTCQ